MITTHVLDIASGSPAVGVTVILEMRQASEWTPIGRGTTDENGRVASLTDDRELIPGTYRLTFDVGSYFASTQRSTFYRVIRIEFEMDVFDRLDRVGLID